MDFLAETNAITRQQLSTILSNLPSEGAAGVASSVSNLNIKAAPATETGYPSEKASNGYGYPSEQPPTYNATPSQPAPLAHAVALYAYIATDAGDLNLQPNDSVAVTEYMNAEWWKGRNERTGADGIFPRSYVRLDESKAVGAGPQPSGYGNMPLDVANGVGSNGGEVDPQKAKLQSGGKKFGKKLGNAAIFGAGASIGGHIVNGIL